MTTSSKPPLWERPPGIPPGAPPGVLRVQDPGAKIVRRVVRKSYDASYEHRTHIVRQMYDAPATPAQKSYENRTTAIAISYEIRTARIYCTRSYENRTISYENRTKIVRLALGAAVEFVRFADRTIFVRFPKPVVRFGVRFRSCLHERVVRKRTMVSKQSYDLRTNSYEFRTISYDPRVRRKIVRNRMKIVRFSENGVSGSEKLPLHL